MTVISMNVLTHITLEEIARKICQERSQADRFPAVHDLIIELSRFLTKEQVVIVINTLQTGVYTP